MNATVSSHSRTKSASARTSSPRVAATRNTRSVNSRDNGNDDNLPNFGTTAELVGTRTPSPSSSRTIALTTPYTATLSGRTAETLRRAKEKQAEQARNTPAPKSSLNRPPTHRFNSNVPSSISRTRVQTPSAFNAAKARPKTPVTSVKRASTPTTPTSPRYPRYQPSLTASPRSSPNAVRVTSAGSSMVVRDAIKKAKEAHQQKLKKSTPPRARQINYNDETVFDDISNPFNVSPSTPPLQTQLRRAVENGRTTGNLNISNLELQEIPEEVYAIYEIAPASVVVDFSSRASGWYESVDLQRFNASGNEIAEIGDRIPAEFGAMKHFDMHLNKLSLLPSNFESLQFLRTLNLSKNALSIDALETITKIVTLVELYLAHNNIEGPLPSEIAELVNMQVFDLEGNKISSVPDTIGRLHHLRILLLGENELEDLPWKAFRSFTALYDLDLHSNKLSGELLPTDLDGVTLTALSNLDLHSNSLTSLPSNLHLPSLTQFNAMQNNLVSTGTFFTTTPRLVHLYLSRNQLSTLPDGVINLTHLRTLDVANNVIEHVDPRLGFMDELTTFMWLGNLIRIRAWGSMDTEGIKSSLRAKADEASLEGVVEDLATLKVDACRGECAGILDLTKKLESTPLTQETIESHIHATHFPVLSKIILQMNKLSSAPTELSLVTTLTTLDLSKNQLSAKVFTESIVLPSLVHLDISVNKIDSLEILPTILSAPALRVFEASFNNLTKLIPLHQHYPNLTTLQANSNQITSITPSDLDGLEIVQLNNNDINRLPPELGLVPSLRVLGVDGNTFRVPGRRIVEAGSVALLEWLRGRCVSSEYTM